MTTTRLLVVDDDTAILNGFKELLSDEGYWVEGASNEQETLSKIKGRYFHLVLMDLVLKETTGLDLIKKIKKVSSETVVMIITAYPTVESAIQSFRAGAFDYLIKPINKKNLLKALRRGEKNKEESHEINSLKRIKEMTEKSNLEKDLFLMHVSNETHHAMEEALHLSRCLFKTKIDKSQIQYLSSVKTNSLQLINLADSVLDIVQIESRTLDLEQIDFNLENIIKDVAKTIYPSLKDKPIEFFYEIDKSVPSCLNGDPRRLRQILMNLLSNAAAVTLKGEISLKARLMTILGGGCHIFFVVKDTGPGIPKKEQLNIFKPFPQKNKPIKPQYIGHGLGLWICKVLVEKMGGLISLHSAEGKGSEFRFSIRFNSSKELSRNSPFAR